MNLRLEHINSIPVVTRTGKDFGFLVMATVWGQDSNIYDVLYDQSGELVTRHQLIPQLEAFFNKSFKPGSLDGKDCLINNVKI